MTTNGALLECPYCGSNGEHSAGCMGIGKPRFVPSETVPSVPATFLQEACCIALAISGHFCENPDEWLRGHEKRLRELEKAAKGVMPSARATSLFETRVDCWYQPHKDPGAKAKQPQRVVVTLVHEAADSEDAIKRAREWADSNAPGSKGRKLLSIEHRSTGTKRLPIVEYANGK